MRIAVELLALLLVVGVVVVAWTASASVLGRSQRRALQGAKWRADHFSRDEQTHVVVTKQLPGSEAAGGESLTVAVVDNSDPAWEEKFHEAMSTARMRAAALNSETDPG